MCTWSKLTGDGILPNGFNDHTQVLFYGFMFHYWLIYLVILYHIWYNVYINVQYTRYVTTCSVRVPILSKNLMLFSQWQSQITSLTSVYSTVYSDADKKNIKAPRHWPLCGEFTGDRWIPRTNGQKRRKCFHLMMSSWSVGSTPCNVTWPIF